MMHHAPSLVLPTSVSCFQASPKWYATIACTCSNRLAIDRMAHCIISRRGFCRDPSGEFGGIFNGVLGGGGLFSLEKRKIHPKIHSDFQIRFWEFRGQNPQCKDLALRSSFS